MDKGLLSRILKKLPIAQIIPAIEIILDTPKNTDRAHLFYEKAGFKKIEKEELPIEYDYPYDDSDFFCLTLNGYQ